MRPFSLLGDLFSSQKRRARGIFWLIMLLVATGSCTRQVHPPNLGDLYNRSASFHDQRRNPVILIPGILGSKLIDKRSGRVVWGEFKGNYANPNSPDGAQLIALPMASGVPLQQLRDSVYASGTLDRVKVKILGLPLQVGAYYKILDALGIGGYVDESSGNKTFHYGSEHFTCFQFDYDWRLDNVVNARRLHQFILEKREYVQKEYQKRYGVSNYNVKFDIVAHSMGGLIARYYLRYGDADLPDNDSLPPLTWAGTRYVDKVILVGTPNAGSLDALENLVKGRKIAPLLPFYESSLLGTLPSIYQLLPRGRHRVLVDAAHPDRFVPDLLDPDLWTQLGWGLADPTQDKMLQWLLPGVTSAEERRQIALDHQRKCLRRARQFMKALDLPARHPDSLSISLMAGDAVPTDAVAAVDWNTGELTILQQAPGDGTVLRSSALMDERLSGNWEPTLVSPIRWDHVFFLFTEHLELTRDPAFTDNLLFMLLEKPRY
ncbi:MAG: hypothetical protein D6748_07205 [Calditrichaeota bacterium]|nr:MAG: hypothetical protein D6748_07205 [Calditrichota bacterium]